MAGKLSLQANGKVMQKGCGIVKFRTLFAFYFFVWSPKSCTSLSSGSIVCLKLYPLFIVIIAKNKTTKIIRIEIIKTAVKGNLLSYG